MTRLYYNQKVLFQTELFGKPYFWMQDPEGTIYLTKAKEEFSELVPDFS